MRTASSIDRGHSSIVGYGFYQYLSSQLSRSFVRASCKIGTILSLLRLIGRLVTRRSSLSNLSRPAPFTPASLLNCTTRATVFRSTGC